VRARIQRAVARMFAEYGPQGWWPVRCERRFFANSRGDCERRYYHPGQFDFPRTRKGRWEIACGAVLTQNTAWSNVERALDGLREANLLTPESVARCPGVALGSLIRPAGYFNQKARYLGAISRWFLDCDRTLCQTEPSRALLELVRPELLRVNGVGPETADSILLYAYRLPTFVVDAYTRRVFGRIGIVEPRATYEGIRSMFELALGLPDVQACVQAWQEAHALIVEHAKRFHGRRTDPSGDFLLATR
jgi:endonuclease III related protein